MRASVTELLNHASIDAKDPERRSGRRKRARQRSENPGLFSEKSGSVDDGRRTERRGRPRLSAGNPHPVCGLASPPTPTWGVNPPSVFGMHQRIEDSKIPRLEYLGEPLKLLSLREVVRASRGISSRQIPLNPPGSPLAGTAPRQGTPW